MSKDEPFVLKELAEKFLKENGFEKAEKYYKEIFKYDSSDYNKSRLCYCFHRSQRWKRFLLRYKLNLNSYDN